MKKFNSPIFIFIFGFALAGLALAGCSLPSSTQPQVNVPQDQPQNQVQEPAPSVVPAEPKPNATTQIINPTPKVQPTLAVAPTQPLANPLSYPIVDTAQAKCYDQSQEIACPASGANFFGQDAQYLGNQPSYTNNNDGTITDNVSALMWQQSPDTNGDGQLNRSDKFTFSQAQALPQKLNAAKFAGYSDWRLPTIKELYSLILFDGTDISGCANGCDATPFINTNYFQFAYGNSSEGERTIDSQYASSTLYVNKSFQGGGKLFGVNFADGRIKGYDLTMPGGSQKTFFVICVRGNPQYGINQFVDQGDQTILDKATGLIWSKADSATTMNWQDALAWVAQKNTENYLGYNDWRMPNVKELQSIVDYTRSPDTTQSAAIDALFSSTQIKNEAGVVDDAFYWTGTTHATSNASGAFGAYVSFGRALGYMNNAWVDVHGAGAQRSDPKSGNPANFPTGHGPQGDAIRILNMVRLVRGGTSTLIPAGSPSTARPTISVESGGIQPSGGQWQSGQMQGGAAGQGAQGGAMQPPQEAIDACSGLTQSTACTVTTPKGTIQGTCLQPPNGGTQLICVPAGGPPSR